jgi:PIN domain nuclease of toxin-antitoxin system
MKILIDTQSIIWFAENNTLLSKTARAAIEDSENTCFVSMASFWEMSIKINLGKLSINGLTLSEFMDEVVENDFQTLDIQRPHILENERLPLFHRDPFDRLIIAQAIVNDMHIISSDDTFDVYPITRIW